VSFRDAHGFTHSVEVTASSLYEAVALGIHAFRQHGLLAVRFSFTQQFTVQGDPTAINLESVTLTNRSGSTTGRP
jgi:hypothetical protein